MYTTIQYDKPILHTCARATVGILLSHQYSRRLAAEALDLITHEKWGELLNCTLVYHVHSSGLRYWL